MSIPDLEGEYRDSQSLNQSSLSILEKSPRDFKKLMDGELDQSGDSNTQRGELIHKLILEPHLVPMQYAIVSGEMPSHKSQTTFIENLPKDITPDQEDIVDAYKAAYSVKSKSESKITTEANAVYERFRDYYAALFSGDDKTIITQSEYDTAVEAAEAAKQHPVISNLLKDYGESNGVTMIEKPIEFVLDDSQCTRASYVMQNHSEDMKNHFSSLYEHIFEKGNTIKLKGKLDKMDIDYDARTIRIVDIKSTGMGFPGFENKFFDYSIDLQAGMYVEAAFYYMIKELGYTFPDIVQYDVEFYFAVININKPEARSYYVSDNSIDHGITKMVSLLNDYVWHVDNDKWEAKPEEYENGGIQL